MIKFILKQEYKINSETKKIEKFHKVKNLQQLI